MDPFWLLELNHYKKIQKICEIIFRNTGPSWTEILAKNFSKSSGSGPVRS